MFSGHMWLMDTILDGVNFRLLELNGEMSLNLV